MAYLDQQTMLKYWKEIFEGTYRVSIKALYTYTKEDIEIIGIPMTGDSYWDGVSANSQSIMNYTVAQLAEIYNRNIEFRFMNQKSLEKIYHHIYDYVDGVVEMFNRNYISEHQIMNNEKYSELINDIQLLANLGNYLRPYIAYARSKEEFDKRQQTKQSISLLAKMISKEREKEANQSAMPREINIRDNMSALVRGDRARPERTIKPWRNRRR